MTAGRIFALLMAGLLCAQARGETVNVAVASNFTAPMRELASTFGAASGHELRLSFGSSGKFYAQIANGAPFELFFSADQDKARALEDEGLAVAGSRFTYAVGRLVLWTPDETRQAPAEELLRRGDFTKLALANPRLAPYGAAAVEVLRSLGLEQATRAQWVLGENIAQTYQFVFSGNAELGFVALSQVLDPDSGSLGRGGGWLVPETMHEPIRQDAVLLPRGESSAAARDFLRYLRGDEASAIIRSYGYSVP